MSTMRIGRALVAFAVVWAGAWAGDAWAAEPDVAAAARTRFFLLRKGSQEIVNFGTLADTFDSDRYIVILIGTGQCKLTVTDADATGDTIRAAGSLLSVFPAVFDQSATSPNKVEQPLLVTGIGLLIFDVNFTSIVNGAPANYIYSLKF